MTRRCGATLHGWRAIIDFFNIMKVMLRLAPRIRMPLGRSGMATFRQILCGAPNHETHDLPPKIALAGKEEILHFAP